MVTTIRYVFLLILYILIAVSFASADYSYNDTISYSYGESKSYNPSHVTYNPQTVSQTSFQHLFTNAKLLNRVRFSGLWSCSLPYLKHTATPFTSTVDGTYYGYGVATVYEMESGGIYFDIDFYELDVLYASSLSGAHTVVLTFQNSPWDDVSQSGPSLHYGSSVTTAQPTLLRYNSGLLVSQGFVLTSYNMDYINNFQYNFNSTYDIGNLTISKTNDESIWDVFDFDNKVYFKDTSFSSVDISQTFTRCCGVYANVTFNDPDLTSIWCVIDLNTTSCDNDPSDFVEWGSESYIIGDTGSISYEISNYDNSIYDYSVDIFKAGFLQTYLSCTSSSGVLEYAFSDITTNTLYYAKLTKYVKGSSIPLVIVTDSCMVYVDTAPNACTISFDQSVYGPNDLVNMSYSNCPNGSRILFRSDSSPWYDSKTYESISGNGSVLYQLSDAPSGIGYYAKVYSDSNIVIASDTMEIEGIVIGYCQIHGGIYDSQDYHPLIGTVFIGNSYSDVVGYSDYGAYSIIVPWGIYNISAAVSSYLSYNSSNVEISGSDYNLDMFLSVNGTTTHVFRGSVADVDSNAAIEDVLIKVYNDTFDEYDFTSQSGVWVVNGLTSGATYTLHATKDEYHSHTYSFTYDPNDFYYNFMMSLVVSEDGDIDDDVIEDALEEDESMTEYFDEKFRGFAPTIWGLFMCMCVLFFMSILTSFNSGNKRR